MLPLSPISTLIVIVFGLSIKVFGAPLGALNNSNKDGDVDIGVRKDMSIFRSSAVDDEGMEGAANGELRPLLLSFACLESPESIELSLDTVGLMLLINVTSDLDVCFDEAELIRLGVPTVLLLGVVNTF